MVICRPSKSCARWKATSFMRWCVTLLRGIFRELALCRPLQRPWELPICRRGQSWLSSWELERLWRSWSAPRQRAGHGCFHRDHFCACERWRWPGSRGRSDCSDGRPANPGRCAPRGAQHGSPLPNQRWPAMARAHGQHSCLSRRDLPGIQPKKRKMLARANVPR